MAGIRSKQFNQSEVAFVGGAPGDVLTFNGSAWTPAAPGGGGGGANPQGSYSCPTTVAVRDAVYLSAASAVDKADSDDSTKWPCIGLVLSKPTATSAIVQHYGEMSGFAGLTPGATYYLDSTPGQITATAPIAPSGSARQEIGLAKSATVLLIMIDRDLLVL